MHFCFGIGQNSKVTQTQACVCMCLCAIFCQTALWLCQSLYESGFGRQIIFAGGNVRCLQSQLKPVAAGWWIRRRLALTPPFIYKIAQQEDQTDRHKHARISLFALLILWQKPQHENSLIMCFTIWSDIIYKYSAASLFSYLLQSSLQSWIHCPYPETHWNKVGPWFHTQFPSWVQIGQHCAQKGPSHPGSARVLVKAVLMSACTELCNPEWTETDDPPEKVNEDKITAVLQCEKYSSEQTSSHLIEKDVFLQSSVSSQDCRHDTLEAVTRLMALLSPAMTHLAQLTLWHYLIHTAPNPKW